MLGGLICMVFKRILGGLGTFVLLFVCMIITLVCITEKSFLRLVQEQGEMAWEDFGRRREVQAERRQQRVRGVDLGATDLVSSKVSRGLRVYDGEKQESEEQREAYLEEKRAKSAGISLMMNETSGKKRQPSGGRNRRMPAQQPMYATMPAPDVNIQPAQFQSFSQVPDLSGIAPENIDLIMDVPLEVTVELGRTSKSIKEILDFSPGTIIELDKLAGEPVDVLVNGKFVAKGEVVVIEESFGIRVTEIIKE